MNSRQTAPMLPTALVLCAGLVVVGSFLPWASIGVFSKNGTDGDGVLTLVVGVVGGFITVTMFGRPAGRWRPVLLVLLFGSAALIGIYDWHDVTTTPEGPLGIHVSVGTGLVLTTLAALAAVVLSVVCLASAGSAGLAQRADQAAQGEGASDGPWTPQGPSGG